MKMACHYDFLYKSSSLKLCWCLFSFMFLGYEESNVAGMLTLSPMTVAPVCLRDPLQITCTASVEFIRWNIIHVDNQGRFVEPTAPVQINSRDANQKTERVINSATFTFKRSSAQGASPLISTLSIDSVNISLNGTVINCTDVTTPTNSVSTNIQITGTNQSTQHTPMLSVSQEYQADHVTVIVGWALAQQMNNITFSTKVSPLVPLALTGNTSHQLIVAYNTEYNLSIVAIAPCDNASTSITLNYVNCGYPELTLTMSNDSVINNVSVVPSVNADYPEFPIEGSIITFSCPPGFALVGPNSITCMKNGEWKPDPSGFGCKGIDSKAHLIGQVIGFFVAVAIILSITAVVVTVILHKKGCIHKVRKQHTQHTQGEKFTTKHLDKESGLVYADLDVTSEARHYVTKEKPTAEPSTLSRDVEYSLIDYSLNVCYEDTQLEGQPKRDDSLDVTLNRLVVLLREKVGPKWREFGEEVDIDEVVLDSIAKTCFPENCLVEVLDYWLKYTDEKITWRDVAYVLKSINFHELALDVVQIYKTGKFPHGANTHANKSPQDCNKQLAEKKHDKTPVDPKKGSGNSSKCQKSPKTPLPLPTKE